MPLRGRATSAVNSSHLTRDDFNARPVFTLFSWTSRSPPSPNGERCVKSHPVEFVAHGTLFSLGLGPIRAVRNRPVLDRSSGGRSPCAGSFTPRPFAIVVLR